MNVIKNSLQKAYKNNKIAIFIFLFECIYLFLVPSNCRFWAVDNITYAYHAVDFSMGFCTKILPGAIYNFIFKNTSAFTMNLWQTILFLLFLAAVSLMLQKVLYKYRDTKAFWLMIFLFLAGPFTLSIFIVEFGMLDVYWVYFAIIAMAFLSDKRLEILIVPMAFLIILVHYSSIICYIPFIFLLLLYKITVSDKKEKTILIITSVLFVSVAFASLFYFLINETGNLTYSMEDFNKILSSRGSDYFKYYDYAFYRDTSGEGYALNNYGISDNPQISNVINVVIQQIILNFALTDYKKHLFKFLLMCPIVFLLYKYFFSLVKQKERSGFQRIVFVGMMAMFLVTFLGGCLFSTDIIRWASHALICLFASFMYVNYKEDKVNFKVCEKSIKRLPAAMIISYCIIYFLTSYKIYT